MGQFLVDIILPYYKPHAGWLENDLLHLIALRQYFKTKNIDVKLIAVNDGEDLSAFTEENLKKLEESIDSFKFITYPSNRGKGFALRAGVMESTGKYQIYTDYDFPFSYECVIEAYEKLAGGADVVMGIRGDEYNSVLSGSRKWISRAVRVLNMQLLGLSADKIDTQAGFKAFNATGRRAFLSTRVDTFMFDTEFILISSLLNLKIESVFLKLRPNLHFSKMGFRTIFRELSNLMHILWRVRICRNFGKITGFFFI